MLIDLTKEPIRCSAKTVAYGDDDPESGAGAVPADFDGRTVLRCELDYASMHSRDGVESFTIRQWSAPLTAQLRAAFDLPDRELRPARACAAGTSTATAVYFVDARRQSVRVLLPYDDPCHQIREEVANLLLANAPPAEATFHASREAR